MTQYLDVLHKSRFIDDTANKMSADKFRQKWVIIVKAIESNQSPKKKH